ncbi:MAG: DUF4258 domain-containing protein [Acidimicrobiales bacterium]
MAHLTDYAKKRMEERGVSPEDVEVALSQEIRPPRAGNRPGRLIKAGLDGSGRIIEIVQNEHGDVVNVLIPKR